MKNRIIIIGGIVTTAVLILVGYQVNKWQATSKSLVVQPIDEKGIFVGDTKLSPAQETERRRQLYPVQQKEWEEHQKTLRGIDEAWDYIGLGSKHFKAGDFEKAAEAYEKAYAADPRQRSGTYAGTRSTSGRELARTYEKMGRYEDGINTLNQMLGNNELNDFGIKMAHLHIARLEALKAGKPVPEDKDPTNPIPSEDPSAYVFPNEQQP